MTSKKTVERVVAHPRYYQKVDGKNTHVPVGTTVTVTEEQAKKAGSKLVAPGSAKVLQGGQLVDSVAGGKPGSKKEAELIAKVAELTAANADLTAKSAALEAQVAELTKK